jgi:thiol-disulfide isomerase/thioredoxin
MKKGDWVGRIAFALSIGSAALVLLTVGALAMPAARARLGLAPVRTSGYPVGGRIDVPPSVYDASPYTVVLFARSTCVFCQRARPLFAKLAADVAEDPSVRMVMVSSPSGRTGDLEYARSVGLDESRIVVLDPRSLRLKTVPTLVLVDRQGQVRYSHEGMPTAADLEELLRTTTVLNPRR